MIKDNLAPEVAEFIQMYIHSLEELEILVIFQDDPSLERTIDDLNKNIRSSVASITSRVKSLERNGLLSEISPARYKFLPASKDLEYAAQSLVAAYKERRVSVIEAIFSKPLAGIREFAEAFKFKGGKNE